MSKTVKGLKGQTKVLKKLNMNLLAEDVVAIEGGKKQVNIAQAKEILGIVADMLTGSKAEEVLKVLISAGKRRAKAFAKKKVVKKVAKNAKKKVSKKASKKKVAKTDKKKVSKKASKKKVAKKTTKKGVAKKTTKKVSKKRTPKLVAKKLK